jgi:hypothetical protein
VPPGRRSGAVSGRAPAAGGYVEQVTPGGCLGIVGAHHQAAPADQPAGCLTPGRDVARAGGAHAPGALPSSTSSSISHRLVGPPLRGRARAGDREEASSSPTTGAAIRLPVSTRPGSPGSCARGRRTTTPWLSFRPECRAATRSGEISSDRGIGSRQARDFSTRPCGPARNDSGAWWRDADVAGPEPALPFDAGPAGRPQGLPLRAGSGRAHRGDVGGEWRAMVAARITREAIPGLRSAARIVVGEWPVAG